ncbi:MAG: kelch repeat-containing protein, partial [Candidatus Paceibacterota bacterium]
MKGQLVVDGKMYISVARASEMTKYSADYIGQLCRGGKVPAQMTGRIWFVDQDALITYKNGAEKVHSRNGHNRSVATKSSESAKPAAEAIPAVVVNQVPSVPAAPVAIPPIVWSFSYPDGGPAVKYSDDARPLLPTIEKAATEKLLVPGVQRRIVSPLKHKIGTAMAVTAAVVVIGAGSVFASYSDQIRGTVAAVVETTASAVLKADESFAALSRTMSQLTWHEIGGALGMRDRTQNIVQSITRDNLQDNTAAISDVPFAIGDWWRATSVVVVDAVRRWLDLSGGQTVIVSAPDETPSIPRTVYNQFFGYGGNTTPQTIVVTNGATGASSAELNDLRNQVSDLSNQLNIFQRLQMTQNIALSDSIGWSISKAISGLSVGGGGSGSVTSLDASGGTTGLSFSGGPVTSSGTLTLSGILDLDNGGTGTSSAPTYGKLLVGNSAGTYDLLATSSLGISGSGTVTSIATNNGLTGGVISTTGTLGLDTTSIITGALLQYDGTRLAATGTPSLTIGYLIATSTATSTFAAGIQASALNITATNATSTFANGIQLSGGCFRGVDGNCITNSAGGGAVSSVSANPDGTLTISPTTGVVVAGLNLGNSNIWTGLQQFRSASSTSFSAYNGISVGGTATTSIVGDLGTSTFASFISAVSASTTATSTLAGVNLPYGGCFAINGVCIGGTNGTVTSVNASGGTTGLSFSGGPVTTSGLLTLAGILGVGNGGTGWSAISAGTLLYGNGSGALATTTAGTAGNILAFLNGVPTWTATTTYGTGLTYSSGNVTVNASQNISTLSNLTSNGLVRTSGGTGALSVDTTAYLSGTVGIGNGGTGLTGIGASSTILQSNGTSLVYQKLSPGLFTTSNISQWTNDAGYLTSTFAYPFSLTGNATSTLTQFNGGLTAYASSTIGDGTQTGGLTINGGATTTGNAYFAGNVGIGKNPTTKLDVNGNITASSVFANGTYLGNSGGEIGTYSGDAILVAGGFGAEKLRIKTTGLVGIGTTSPSRLLSIQGDALFSGNLALASLTATGTVRFTGLTDGCLQTSAGIVTSSGSPCGAGGGSSGTWSTTTSSVAGQFVNYPNNSTDIVAIGANSTTSAKFWFDPNTQTSYLSGNVGFGTTSPWRSLSVYGDSDLGTNALAGYFTATSTATSSLPNLLVSSFGLSTAAAGCAQFGAGGFLTSTGVNCGSGSGSSFGKSWEINAFGALAPTTTIGIMVNASSTIGDGTQAGGLTINGGATTTGNAYFAGTITTANLTLAALTGPLQAVDGVVSAASTIYPLYGGTGLNAVGASSTVLQSTGASLVYQKLSPGLFTTPNISQWTNDAGYLTSLAGAASSTLLADNNSFTGLNSFTYASSTAFTSTGSAYLATLGGSVGIGTTTPGSLLSVGNTNGINFSTATSTFSSTGGINLASGCFAVNGTCVGTNLGTVTSVGLASTNSTLTIGSSPITSSGNITVDLNLATANIWTGLQQFKNASSTQLSVYGPAYFGATATSTFTSAGWLGIGTSTPYAKLSIAGTAGQTNPYLAIATSSTAGAAPFFYIASSTGFTLDGGVVNPTHVGRLLNGGGSAPYLDVGKGVFVSGNYAYIAVYGGTGAGALEIVDISDPRNPVHKGSLLDGVGGAVLYYPSGIFVSGNYAYITRGTIFGDQGLEIVDVSNPAKPVHKGSINDTQVPAISGANGVFVSGNYAYVIATGGVLVVIDVSDPANPRHAGSSLDAGGGGSGTSVFVSGNYAYVTATPFGDDYLGIIDISNPSNPINAGQILDGAGGADINSPSSVFVSGKYAYIASEGGNALEIVDISNPAAPAHKGKIIHGSGGANLSNPSSVFVSGNYAYVTASGNNALEIVDVSNPAAPVHKGKILAGEGGAVLTTPRSVFVSGNYAYIATLDGSFVGALEIVDVGAGNISNIAIGNARIDTLQVGNLAQFNQGLFVHDGLNVGTNAMIGGALTVSGISSTTASNQNPVSALFLGGRVGIGTTTPYSRMSIWGSGTGSNRLFEITNSASTTLASFLENGTGYFAGSIGIGTTTPGSLLSIGNTNGINFSTATSTFSSTGGINLASGCFAINGTCVGTNLGTVTSVGLSSTNSTLSIGSSPITSSGTITVDLNLATANIWTGLQQFARASSTMLSVYGPAYFGATATSTFTSTGWLGIGTSTPYAALSVVGASGVVADKYFATSTTATSTFAGGVSFTNGSFENYTSGVTSISNLLTGNFNFETNAGNVSWVDLPVTSAAPAGTVESYAAQIGGVPLLTLYSESDGVGSTKARRVAIGTSTPYATLTIWASSTPENIFQVVSSASSTLAVINSIGNLGLGTTSPFSKFSVQGNALFSGDLSLAGLTATGTVTLSGLSGGLVKSTAGVLSAAIAGTDYVAPSSLFGKSWEIDASGALAPTTTIGIMVNASSTIGDGTQAGGLTISGGATTTGTLQVSGTGTSTFAGFIDVNGTGTNATSTFASNLWVKGTLRTGTGSLYLNDSGINAANNGFSLNTTGNSFVNGIDGNFGIGTSSPYAKLSVTGVGTGTGINFQTADSTNHPLFSILDNGNVGIGTVNPMALLQTTASSTVELGMIGSPFLTAGYYQNFLLQTEAFATTWTRWGGVPLPSSNSARSPDQALTAEVIQAGTHAGGSVGQYVTNSTQGNWNFSVYLQSTTSPNTTIPIVIMAVNGNSTTTVATSTITLTSDWTRYSVSMTDATTHTRKFVQINNGTTQIAAWGAQLEPSHIARVYSGVRTTTGVTTLTSGTNSVGAYSIGGTSVLSASTLGSGVTASSLTSLGILTNLTVEGAAGSLNGNITVNNGSANFSSGSTTLNLYKNIGADTAGTWSTGTAGGTARHSHTSVLYNGNIYSWGGTTTGLNYFNTLYIYNIASNTWSTGTAGGTARYDHTSVLYNGKIYSWGGGGSGGILNTVDIYDIASNTWSTGTAGGTARYAHTSVLYNGKIYS